jgi:hypothetical protein
MKDTGFYVTSWHMLVQSWELISYYVGGRRGRDRMVVEFTTTYAIVPITTNVVSSDPVQSRCTQYNIMW